MSSIKNSTNCCKFLNNNHYNQSVYQKSTCYLKYFLIFLLIRLILDLKQGLIPQRSKEKSLQLTKSCNRVQSCSKLGFQSIIYYYTQLMERSSVILSDTKILSFVNWIDDAEPNPDYMTEGYQFGHPKKKPKQSIISL